MHIRRHELALAVRTRKGTSTRRTGCRAIPDRRGVHRDAGRRLCRPAPGERYLRPVLDADRPSMVEICRHPRVWLPDAHPSLHMRSERY